MSLTADRALASPVRPTHSNVVLPLVPSIFEALIRAVAWSLTDRSSRPDMLLAAIARDGRTVFTISQSIPCLPGFICPSGSLKTDLQAMIHFLAPSLSPAAVSTKAALFPSFSASWKPRLRIVSGAMRFLEFHQPRSRQIDRACPRPLTSPSDIADSSCSIADTPHRWCPDGCADIGGIAS